MHWRSHMQSILADHPYVHCRLTVADTIEFIGCGAWGSWLNSCMASCSWGLVTMSPQRKGVVASLLKGVESPAGSGLASPPSLAYMLRTTLHTCSACKGVERHMGNTQVLYLTGEHFVVFGGTTEHRKTFAPGMERKQRAPVSVGVPRSPQSHTLKEQLGLGSDFDASNRCRRRNMLVVFGLNVSNFLLNSITERRNKT